MARAQKLKVFRTPIGFHDAYVAAPSQKAALEAWGSDHDLFARGVAERVEDPKLMKAALAQPGVVLRRLRGSADEHFAALPPEPKRKPAKAEPEPKAKPAKRHKPPPKPDRAPLREAERALAKAEAAHEAELKTLERREAALARERAALERKQADEQAKLERKVEAEQARYDRAEQTRSDWESN